MSVSSRTCEFAAGFIFVQENKTKMIQTSKKAFFIAMNFKNENIQQPIANIEYPKDTT